MSEDIAAKVKKLVATAAAHVTSKEATNEAINAALKACRLIQLHALEIHKSTAKEVAKDVAAEVSRSAKAGRKPKPETIVEIAVDAIEREVGRGARRAAGDVARALIRGRR